MSFFSCLCSPRIQNQAPHYKHLEKNYPELFDKCCYSERIHGFINVNLLSHLLVPLLFCLTCCDLLSDLDVYISLRDVMMPFNVSLVTTEFAQLVEQVSVPLSQVNLCLITLLVVKVSLLTEYNLLHAIKCWLISVTYPVTCRKTSLS